MGGVIDAANQWNIQLVPGVYASATPGGIVSAEAAQRILEQLPASIEPGLDGLVVILHGAMVSEQHCDMEVALLEAIRAVVGQELPIAATVDLHANLGTEMSALCSLLVGYDRYPHIDAYERGMEAVDLLLRHLNGEIKPRMAIARPNMLVVPQTMITTEGVMKSQPGPVFHLMFIDQSEVSDFDTFQLRDTQLYTRFAEEMLNAGILVRPNGLWYVSAAHGEAEVRETLDAVERVAMRIAP